MVERIAIIGAGISGLLACKYTLSKGLTPIVFESQDEVGGVWTKTIRTTKLQTPKSLYQFSDFPWPPSLVQNFPTQNQVLEYIQSYARHHALLSHIKLNTRVVSVSYDGPPEEEMRTWTLWGGTGKPFGPKGKWKVTVQDTGSLRTEVHRVDFVIMCAGKYSDSPNIPEFPPDKGPEVFQGKVIHSMDYSAMDNASAAKLIQGNRVAVVGFQKSGMDISMECSSANGIKQPCTLLYRTEHWNMPDFLPWGVPWLISIKIASLSSWFISLRWGVSKFVESHIKKKLRLAKHGMVPKHSFFKELNSCSMATVPEGFFDRVEEGSIILKKAERFSFCSQGILIDSETEPLKIDLLVLATGFKGAHKLKAAFTSPTFRDLMDKDTRLPLYRECIHPRIPQLAFIGVSESIANLFTSEMTCRWLAELLDGTFKLPSITEMEKDVCQWNNYMKQSLGESYNRSCLGAAQIWYNDQLCKDMGWKPHRKKGPFRELFEPYGLMDYA
ncbi:putative flavin-containing monooxygenase 1 [Sesamum alatum]|uniref:Flavin-containing monooxygenase n=1 Tax=Sesamum alatum TaxID=300844 RepID=A0AAE1YXH8_9LAMI|nr:putative flavin-containing monooxygenase 1 [Sesamum alatum]